MIEGEYFLVWENGAKIITQFCDDFNLVGKCGYLPVNG
jgi:hypothetical protein